MIRQRLLLTSAAALLAVSFGIAAASRADDVPPKDAAGVPDCCAEVEGVRFETGNPAFEDVLAKAKELGKPVFIDFMTENCGWCRKLERETYTQASVGKVMQSFVNLMVDAGKGDGAALAKRYGVSVYPTLVVVDATGSEIDRIVGFRAAAPFTKEVGRILSGEGTLPTLRKAHEAAPSDVAAGMALGAKLISSNPADATALFEKLIDQSKSSDRATQGSVRLEYAAALLGARQGERARTEAESLVRDFADTPAAGQVATRVGGAFAETDTKRALAFLDAARPLATDAENKMAVEDIAIAVHRSAVGASLLRQGAAAGDDPQALNQVAWTCFEQKLNVRAATLWARTAVEKSTRDPMILDTLANLLWLTADPAARAEALALETEAAAGADLPAPTKKEFDLAVARWTAELKASETLAK